MLGRADCLLMCTGVDGKGSGGIGPSVGSSYIPGFGAREGDTEVSIEAAKRHAQSLCVVWVYDIQFM